MDKYHIRKWHQSTEIYLLTNELIDDWCIRVGVTLIHYFLFPVLPCSVNCFFLYPKSNGFEATFSVTSRFNRGLPTSNLQLMLWPRFWRFQEQTLKEISKKIDMAWQKTCFFALKPSLIHLDCYFSALALPLKRMWLKKIERVARQSLEPQNY